MNVLAFDIETGAAEELHRYGPGYVRLCGWAPVDGSPNGTGPVTLSTDPAELTAALFQADALTAHNGINFDLMALGRQGYFSHDDYERLCLKMFDTMIVERHVNPVAAKGVQPMGYFGLDATAERYGLAGKSTVDFAGKLDIVRRVKGDAFATKMLKAYELRKRKAGAAFVEPKPVSVLKLLAELFGGFDKIPQNDPDYRRYLVMDVQAQGRLFTRLSGDLRDHEPKSQRYVRREHYTARSMGRVTLEGMRSDVDETMRRWSEGQARLEAGKELLHQKFGMPTEGAYPHRTNEGKAAFRRAILSTGISEDALAANWPMAKDGSLKTGKDVLDEFIPIFEQTKPAAAELCRTIKAFNGERTIYGTVLDHLVGDRVHPYIGPDQASGRWSMKDPGLTVFGKRGGKARERGIMLADNDDEVLVAIDADQVDARVIAAECQDTEYMKLFVPGKDLHSEVAWLVWPSEADHGGKCHNGSDAGCGCGTHTKCHCDKRDKAKVSGHGFSYGLGANGMSRQQGIPVADCQRFINGFTEAFPRLAEWKGEIREAAGALGFDEPVPANDSYRILHTWAGRPVRVERDRAYTQATALVGQGGTRDVMAEAILRLPPEYRRRIRAVIHDEIVLSLPKHNAQQVAQSITDSMAFDLRGVEITFGCSEVARSWAGCYGAEYETAA